jgi:hypothetical protein
MLNGRQTKFLNAVISSSFLIPAVLLAAKFPVSPIKFTLWFLIGLVWANWFEYVYHRWADHMSGTSFERKHRVHHAQPSNGKHINLGENGLTTLMMFVINGGPVVTLDLWLHGGFSSPFLIACVIYVLLIEEIHWRSHMGGWLPASLKAYHLDHHKHPLGRFNICFPLFDWIFGTL